MLLERVGSPTSIYYPDTNWSIPRFQRGSSQQNGSRPRPSGNGCGAAILANFPRPTSERLRAETSAARKCWLAAKLLKTKKFRSEFRLSLRDQLVAWLELAPADRKYDSPFSPRQWGCLITSFLARKADAMDRSLYQDRSPRGVSL